MTAAATQKRPRRLGLLGGSFDPVHNGHLAVARAACRRFQLDEVHFIPAGRPPHKLKHELAPFPHRYAMVALACAGQRRFVPSLAEAGADFSGREPHYSVDTVRRYRREYPHAQLYFLTGADAFLEIPTWKDYEKLLSLCDFIVASRPGFRLQALRLVIPPGLLGRTPSRDWRTIPLRHTAVHLLETVASRVSSTEIRRRRRQGHSIHGLVPLAVEEYILKLALYA